MKVEQYLSNLFLPSPVSHTPSSDPNRPSLDRGRVWTSPPASPSSVAIGSGVTDPDEGVFEDGHDAAVDGVTDVLHSAVPPHDDGVTEVRVLPRLLGVDPDQSQHLPHGEQQVVEVQLHVTAAVTGTVQRLALTA